MAWVLQEMDLADGCCIGQQRQDVYSDGLLRIELTCGYLYCKHKSKLAQLAGAAEYTNCIFAKLCE